MFDPEETYSLQIKSKFLEFRCITDKTITQIDFKYIYLLKILSEYNTSIVFLYYREHVKRFSFTKYNQLRLELGTKFTHGSGVLFFSFPEDKTSGIVYTKIAEITERIKTTNQNKQDPKNTTKINSTDNKNQQATPNVQTPTNEKKTISDVNFYEDLG